MANQTPLSGSFGNGSVPEGVVGSLAEFGNDISTLAELQAKLTVIDLKESGRRALFPTILLAVALAILLGCVPIALVGVAYLLQDALSIDLGWSFLLTAGIALVLGLALAGIAGYLLSRSFTSLRRSSEELSRNLAWIKTVVLHSGRSVRRR